ncbi:tautomerase family protein [[Eubacterium] cellulosolvens]
MPVVNIYMWSGRSAEQKKMLAKGITEVFQSAAAVPPEALHIIFQDIEKSDWAIAGKLCSE